MSQTASDLLIRADETTKMSFEFRYLNVASSPAFVSPKAGWPGSLTTPTLVYIGTGGIQMTIIASGGAYSDPMEDQSYYWTPKWQSEEAQAMEDLESGDYVDFSSADDAIAWLKQG